MSNDSILFDPDPREDDVTRGLRAIYAAPGGEGYWAALESRIMRYVLAAESAPWWTAFGGWTRAGAVAAAVVLIAVAVATKDAHDAEVRAAYDAIIDDSVPVTTFERVSRTPGLSKTDAAFLYVISDRD
jgi:hypothetical protein